MKIGLIIALLSSVIAGGTVRGATLFFAGDSTLDDHGRKLGVLYASWGTELERSMVPGCKVDNRARSGESTKSFIAGGYWDKLIADVKPGDFVGIEFGHNDQKNYTPYYLKERWCAPQGAFKDNVRHWVKEVREKGATPILLSPIVRATFDREGVRLVDKCGADGVCLGSYRDAMAELAQELKCDYVDMNTLTREALEKMGRDEAYKCYFISTGTVLGRDGEPSRDTTHPVKAGAELFSSLFLSDVRRQNLSVAKLFGS